MSIYKSISRLNIKKKTTRLSNKKQIIRVIIACIFCMLIMTLIFIYILKKRIIFNIFFNSLFHSYLNIASKAKEIVASNPPPIARLRCFLACVICFLRASTLLLYSRIIASSFLIIERSESLISFSYLSSTIFALALRRSSKAMSTESGLAVSSPVEEIVALSF